MTAKYVLSESVKLVVGALISTIVFLCALLSIPVYLYRLLIIQIAKYFRPDLGEILNGQSAIFVGDYFAASPPRSYCVLTLTFEGRLTLEEVKTRVLRNWILARDKSTGKSAYEILQQYPVRFMGFAFWKDIEGVFCIDKHVRKLYSSNTEVTREVIANDVECMLNCRLPPNQSPWEIGVIENYKFPGVKNSSDTKGKMHSAFLIKFHHCITDATGILTALTDGFCGNGYSFSKMDRAQPKYKRRSWLESLWYNVSLPLQAFLETSHILSHYLQRNSSLKIPDNRKKWHQVYATSPLIPMELIKKIKNNLGVSYTGVLLSAMAAAVHRLIEDKKATGDLEKGGDDKSTLCLSMLPAKGIRNRGILANHMTGAVFELPLQGFGDNRIRRLRAVDGILEKNKNSIVPTIVQGLSTILGAHLYVVNTLLVENRLIPISLSNFAGVPEIVELSPQLKWVFTEAIVGGFRGEAGLFMVSFSHGQHLGLQLSAEEAIMSKAEANLLIKYALDEIDKYKKSLR